MVVEQSGGGLVVRAAAMPRDRSRPEAFARPEPGRTGISVDDAAAAALHRLDDGLVADLRRHLCPPDAPPTGARLLLGGAAAPEPDGGAPIAARLADRLGVEVVAPDGPLVVLRRGELFSAGTHAAWWAFRPGRPPAREGSRYPAPDWQADLPADLAARSSSALTVTPTPAGLWVRAADHGPAELFDPGFAVPPARQRVVVVVGRAGEEPPPVAGLAAVIKLLPPALRREYLLVPYGPGPAAGSIAQQLADRLGEDVRTVHTLPTYSTDGSLGWAVPLGESRPGWHPFVAVSVCHPGDAAPTPWAWRPPVAGMATAGPGSFWLTDSWVVDVVPSGLLVRPAMSAAEPSIVRRPADPRHVDLVLTAVFAAPNNVPRPVLEAVAGLVRALPEPVQERLRIVASDRVDPAGPSELAVALRLSFERLAKGGTFAGAAGAGAVGQPGPPDRAGSPPGPVEHRSARPLGRLRASAVPFPGGEPGPLPAAPAEPEPRAAEPRERRPAKGVPARGEPAGRRPDVPVTKPGPVGSGLAAGSPRGRPVTVDRNGRIRPAPVPPATERHGDTAAEILPAVPTAATDGSTSGTLPMPAAAPAARPFPQAGPAPATPVVPTGAAPAALAPPAAEPADPSSVRGSGSRGARPDVSRLPAGIPAPAASAVAVPPDGPLPATAPAIPAAGVHHMARPAHQGVPERSSVLPTQPLAAAAPSSTSGRSATAGREVGPVRAKVRPGRTSAAPAASGSPAPAAATVPPDPGVPMSVRLDHAVPACEQPEPAAPVETRSPSSGPPPAVPADEWATHASTSAERQQFRLSLGWRYDSASRYVTRLLSERPGLRAERRADDGLTPDLAAVHVFATTDTTALVGSMRTAGAVRAADRAFLSCTVSGLRRLPAVTGLVVRGGPDNPAASDAYLPGTEVVERGPLVAVADPEAEVPGVIEVLIWSATARRLDGLVEDTGSSTAVFLPGTTFCVLAVDAEMEPRQVLLAERPTGWRADVGPEREARILARLRAAARARTGSRAGSARAATAPVPADTDDIGQPGWAAAALVALPGVVFSAGSLGGTA